MFRYVLQRVLFVVLMLWLVSVLVFVMFFVLPAGDPTRRFTGKETSAEAAAEVRRAYGLDKPLHEQYLRFAEGFVPLPGMFLDEDVYYSYNDAVAVRTEIADRAPVTVVLAVGAALLWVLVSVPLGILGALRPRSPEDRTTMAAALVFISIPSFTLAYLLLYVLWYRLGVVPPSGLPQDASLWEAVTSGRFVLPWIALAMFFLALYTRMTRSLMIESLASDPVRTARAKGLPERTVIGRHALRAAAVPLLTMFALDFGALLGGTVVIETVFNLPGLGQYAVQAVTGADLPAVMGLTLFSALAILVANLAADVLYAILDPRIRYA